MGTSGAEASRRALVTAIAFIFRLDVAVDAEGRVELQVDASGHQLGISLRPALEGNVQQVDARLHLEQLSGEVHRAAEAGARIRELAGLLLRQRDQLGEVPAGSVGEAAMMIDDTPVMVTGARSFSVS